MSRKALSNENLGIMTTQVAIAVCTLAKSMGPEQEEMMRELFGSKNFDTFIEHGPMEQTND